MSEDTQVQLGHRILDTLNRRRILFDCLAQNRQPRSRFSKVLQKKSSRFPKVLVDLRKGLYDESLKNWKKKFNKKN